MDVASQHSIIESLRKKKGTEAYSTTAEVTRIDGTDIYVRIPGSDGETCVENTSAAVSVGDLVDVSVSNYDTHITGNRTAPSTDDTRAIGAEVSAAKAQLLAEHAQNDALTAAQAASSALEDAAAANDAATEAKADAETAKTEAEAAKAESEAATAAAAEAAGAASEAHAAAIEAQGSADTANAAALEAQGNAASAYAAAIEAKGNATTASTAASQAVEDARVAGIAASRAQTAAEAAQDAADAAQGTANAAQGTAEAAQGDATTALGIANSAQGDATAAKSLATTAKTSIDEQREWFWHDADGAHVLSSTGGYVTDITSEGMNIVDMETQASVAEFGIGGASFYKDMTNVAYFGSGYAQIGDGSKAHTTMTVDGIESVYNVKNVVPSPKVTTQKQVGFGGTFYIENDVNPQAGEYLSAGSKITASFTILTQSGSQVQIPVYVEILKVNDDGTTTKVAGKANVFSASVEFISDGESRYMVAGGDTGHVTFNGIGVTYTSTLSYQLQEYTDEYHTGMNLYQGSMEIDKDLSVGGSLSVGGNSLLDIVYPVGAIYMSTKSTSPQTLFGGTWQRIANGRVLVGAGTSDKTYQNGATGGASTHKLTIDEMPSHSHATYDSEFSRFVTASAGVANSRVATSTSGTRTVPSFTYATDGNTFNSAWANTATRGGSTEHENMPPYLVVYMWERTE